MAEFRDVEGRRLTLPVEIRDAAVGTAVFRGDLRAARALLPDGLAPVRIGPNTTPVTLVMADYRDNDIGTYREVAIQLAVARPGPRGQVGALARIASGRPDTWTVAMPVTLEASRAAGCQIWGFPKTLDDVQIEIGPSRASCHWHADGDHVLTLSVPVGRSREMQAPPLRAFTMLDGQLSRTDFRMGADHGRLGLGGAALELGDHPVAEQLRDLGLSRRAMLTTWMDDVTASFGAPKAD